MKTKIVALLGAMLFGTSVFAAEITPYGTFNYKYSHDENSSGKAYSKLEDNGSNIGIDIDDIGVEGQTIIGFAKLEVGVDTDDSGSDTFDSRLAYVGLSANSIGDISVGRQSHPFTDNIGGKTAVFNVYGSKADWNYASRSSQTIAYSNDLGIVSVDALGIVDGSSSNTDAFDEYEWTVSTNLFDSDISVGYADDVNNDISYWGAGASTSLGPITFGSSYTIYDAATDKSGLELVAGYSLSIADVDIGYADKEGTGVYYTAGITHGIGDHLSLYAEGEMADLDTGTDTTSYSIGTKFTF
jgi:predicted porin